MKPTLTKPMLSKSQAALAFAEPKKEASEKRSFSAPQGHKRLTINLPEDLHKQLRVVSAQRGVNATDIIIALLVQELGM
jgi:hypothetical protein